MFVESDDDVDGDDDDDEVSSLGPISEAALA
jgi:hypothetical protein